MSYLLIIGNGFDLAHGLKTRYSDFMEYLINEKIKDKNAFSDLFELDKDIPTQVKTFEQFKKSDIKTENIIISSNHFFRKLANEYIITKNWCDIEKEYFKSLLSVKKNNPYKSPKRLNDDFEIIKKHLSNYLKIEQEKSVRIKAYEELFDLANTQGTTVLNFNYTDTVKKYIDNFKNIDLIQIHGSLENDKYPIVFGYAADDRESRELINLEDNEYMRNIKKHNYKRSDEEVKLQEFLNNNERTDLLVLGHSCGISDKLILNQIFNHKKVNTIRTFYYDNYDNYFETQVNIDRIMNNDSNFKKLINYKLSSSMPQRNEDILPERFNYVLDAMKKQLTYDSYSTSIIFS